MVWFDVRGVVIFEFCCQKELYGCAWEVIVDLHSITTTKEGRGMIGSKSEHA
jgi:hypothetical protein